MIREEEINNKDVFTRTLESVLRLQLVHSAMSSMKRHSNTKTVICQQGKTGRDDSRHVKRKRKLNINACF